jgi:hypothetical protein
LAKASGGPDRAKSSHIAPHALVTMFRAAAQNGPCPTEDMLDNCTRLRDTAWVREVIAHAPNFWEPSQREVHGALETLSQVLPEFLAAYRLLVEHGGFDDRNFGVLVLLNEIVPAALSVTEPFPGSGSRAWHGPATLIALDAMKAWRLAGRRQFGCNRTSPLVKFVQAFLASAGVHQEPGTIAQHFQRGPIARAAKQPTTSDRQV